MDEAKPQPQTEPHPHAGQFLTVIRDYENAVREMSRTLDSGLNNFEKANGLLLAIARFDEFTSANLYEILDSRLPSLVVQTKELASKLATTGGNLAKLRAYSLNEGQRDPNFPTISRSDFGSGLLVFDVPGPASLAGRWASLPADHPARPFLEGLEPAVSPGGSSQLLILSASPDPGQSFDVFSVIALTSRIGRHWKEQRLEAEAKERDQREREKREWEASEPQRVIERLRRENEELRQRLAR